MTTREKAKDLANRQDKEISDFVGDKPALGVLISFKTMQVMAVLMELPSTDALKLVLKHINEAAAEAIAVQEKADAQKAAAPRN